MNIKLLFKKALQLCCAIFLFLGVLFGNEVIAQSGSTISGVVTEESGSPLPGVNIIEKGTTNGVVTDFDGKYTIKVTSANPVLEISFMGFQTKSISVAGKTSINVVLVANLESLDEVLVIGYGTARKSDLTGSVVSVSGDDLKNQSIPSVAEAMTGRMAGVQVTSAEGSPDSEVSIRIRGSGSLTQDSSPLIIVDGFPVNSMSDVSPSNVESITVLKDASSTAIYGSRGANGVIIITTKSGRSGKIEVNFTTFYGQKQIANTIDVQEPEDFVKWQYEYALLEDDLPSYEKYFGQWQDYDQYIGMEGNNWQKQIYGRTGEVKSYDIGIRGGSENVSYNFNYNHYDEKTIMVGSDFKRDNLLLSLKNKASDKIDLSFTVRYSGIEVNGGGANEQNEVSSADARLRHSVGYSPIPLPGLTTDDTDEALSSYLVNPFVAVDDNQRTQLKKNFNMLGSFSWEILEDLNFKSDFGLDNLYYQDYRFYGRSTYYARNKPAAENQGLPSLAFFDQKTERFRNANTINYDFQKILKNDDHSLKILVGEEMIMSQTNRTTSEIQGYPKFFDFDNSIKLTTQGDPQTVDNYYSPDDKLLSFFGRLNYDYKNRYLITGTYRADGSSKFSNGNQWGYFPSAAIAWKMSEEAFLKDVTWINTLKLRLSYGEAGNNNIPSGQTVQNFESQTTTYVNGIANYWAASKVLANPDLKWETTVTQNFGLDFDILKSRLTGSVEVYKNNTKDLLINFPIPGSGYDSQYRNMGEIENKGFEATLNIAAIQKEKFNLDLSFNIGINESEILSLGVMDDFGISTGWASSQIGDDYVVRVGQAMGQMFGYQSDGRYEVSDFDYNGVTGYTLKPGVVDNTAVVGTVMPGTMKLKDITGDGLVTVDDNSVIGNAYPKYSGGFVLNANGYGFDLSAAFNYSVGNDVYNANKIEFTTSNNNGQYRNLSSQMEDGSRWTNLDPASGQLVSDPTELAALNENTTMWSPYMSRYVFSDWAVEDGSFLRLNTLTLGYSFDESIVSSIGATKLRLYLTATNVFIITNYSGLDPEVSTRRKTPLTPGVDYSPFPRSKSLVVGLNFNF